MYPVCPVFSVNLVNITKVAEHFPLSVNFSLSQLKWHYQREYILYNVPLCSPYRWHKILKLNTRECFLSISYCLQWVASRIFSLEPDILLHSGFLFCLVPRIWQFLVLASITLWVLNTEVHWKALNVLAFLIFLPCLNLNTICIRIDAYDSSALFYHQYFSLPCSA